MAEESILEEIRQKLVTGVWSTDIALVWQEYVYKMFRAIGADWNDLNLCIGETLFSSKKGTSAGPFLEILKMLEQHLQLHLTDVRKLVRSFRVDDTKLENVDIRGWKVVSMISVTACEGEKNLTIPGGTLGMLTGNINIVPDGVDIVAARNLALDTERLRKLLSDPHGFFASNGAVMDHEMSYWDSTRRLEGDYFLASRLALQIFWFDISSREPSTLNHPVYLPWVTSVPPTT